MKKVCISFCVLSIIVLVAIGFLNFPTPKVEYLRIHVRADSNEQADQNVKYLVKDEIVRFLTPVLSECDTKLKAESVLNKNLKNIESVANDVLIKNGFSYTSSANLSEEEFPTRVYNGVTLSSGYYDALIINLGSGQGDNWWCVVYPPLCFVGEGVGYQYKSKLLAIINEFFKDK